jgi:hypothetical protein
MSQRLLTCLLAALLPFLNTLPAAASAYDAHPKLVILLVVDQFREDYLERYRSDFKDRGFRLFLDEGAYFPNCYFDYANTKTSPGHATLATGAYTDGHGIASNDWWDLNRNDKRPISSVEDPRYFLVGPANGAKSEGSSPRNLLATTFGDEVRMDTNGEARLYGVSLKDRAAILTSGLSANGAFWIDERTGQFLTSSYYMRTLPDWAVTFNNSGRAEQARTEAGVSTNDPFFAAVGPTAAGIRYELDFARALIQGEKLGTNSVTDVLTISISSTDILGHAVGPDSPLQRELVDQLDVSLDQFFTWIDQTLPGGLKDVWIALSADHGIAPVPTVAAQLGIPGAQIDLKALITSLNASLNQQFSPGQTFPYMLSHQQLPYLSLNEPAFERAGLNEQEAERAVQKSLPVAFATLRAAQNPATGAADAATQAKATRQAPEPALFRSYTRRQLASQEPGLPPSEFGRLLAHSYTPNGGWYVMVIPDAFQIGAMAHGTNHFSPYSYDRHVPLGFYGSAFVPGIYEQQVEPVDLAATFAALLGVNQPSASVGHVLAMALRPEKQTPVPHNPRQRNRAIIHTGRTSHPAPAAARKKTPQP